MLSKYYSCLNEKKYMAGVCNAPALKNKMLERYPESVIEPIRPGGTLGIFFEAQIANKRKFIKTHMAETMQKQNLIKELEILKALYADELGIDSFIINDNGFEKLFMIMDYLDGTECEGDISFIEKITRQYSEKLKCVNPNVVNYDMNDLYRASIKSYETLIEKDLITAENALECERTIARFSVYASLEKVLCHGDLSNVNIMNKDGKIFVIDWEDAMWAYPGYDILYWLTFYSQRKYYTKYLFEELKIEKQFGKDMMLLIILIKSFMSYKNKSYLTNKLSINDRITEIIWL